MTDNFLVTYDDDGVKIIELNGCYSYAPNGTDEYDYFINNIGKLNNIVCDKQYIKALDKICIYVLNIKMCYNKINVINNAE